MEFTQNDILQLKKLNITTDDVERQINNFINGFPYLKIIEPATVQRGIMQLSSEQIKNYIEKFDRFTGSCIKFVPASGAASRMFKDLFEAESMFRDGKNINFPSKSMQAADNFFKNIDKFAFFNLLKQKLSGKNIDISKLKSENYQEVLHTLLGNGGLNYGNLPKGLLQFHKYADKTRTAAEEHLAEAAMYAKDKNGKAQIHFTVSKEHLTLFEQHIKEVQQYYQEKYDVKYDISFSVQGENTNTVAVDKNNQMFRNSDGTLLFRPGGHGALLNNLNNLKANIIFIKNIDNVTTDRFNSVTIQYKKALAGLLLELQERIFTYYRQVCSSDNTLLFDEIQYFYENTLFFTFPKNWESDKKSYLKSILFRPIRVCGMVKNEGEPGGGPFLSVNPDGSASVQIAESAQLDLNDAKTQECFKSSTHFNPVDLVCSHLNADNKYFDLEKFKDESTGLISIKSKDGQELKAQELPGLWNGAMSKWNTLFVEVPISTFNPVKTILDLLRKEHQ